MKVTKAATVSAADAVADAEHGAKLRPVKVRDYMYSRKGAPPIMVKAHQRGLPHSKAAEVTPTGAVIGA
jgi:hypothetical protein